jgi:hypothetical protein
VALCVAVADAVRVSDEDAVAEEEPLAVGVAEIGIVGKEDAEASAVWVALPVVEGENVKPGARSRIPKKMSSRARSLPLLAVCAFVSRMRTTPNPGGE